MQHIAQAESFRFWAIIANPPPQATSGTHADEQKLIPTVLPPLRLAGRALLLECLGSLLELIWGYVFYMSRNAPRITERVFDC